MPWAFPRRSLSPMAECHIADATYWLQAAKLRPWPSRQVRRPCAGGTARAGQCQVYD
jgi:hypothetical protein